MLLWTPNDLRGQVWPQRSSMTSEVKYDLKFQIYRLDDLYHPSMVASKLLFWQMQWVGEGVKNDPLNCVVFLHVKVRKCPGTCSANAGSLAFLGSHLSQEVYFPGKSLFLESHISPEVTFPRKSLFLGSHFSREVKFPRSSHYKQWMKQRLLHTEWTIRPQNHLHSR